MKRIMQAKKTTFTEVCMEIRKWRSIPGEKQTLSKSITIVVNSTKKQ